MAVDAAALETLPTPRPPRATLTKARRLGATALAGLGDLLYPPACPACGADTARRPALCPACFAATRLLDAHTPACALCARPEPRLGAPDPGFVCDRCRAAPPVVDALRAAGVYEGALRRLVLALKHADRQDTAALMGGWLARRGADWLAEATHVAPVSLHWRRRLARRGNQAALLAAAA
ncbi:MAG: ComF family protein, partial [Paracoccaceae bacterium]